MRTLTLHHIVNSNFAVEQLQSSVIEHSSGCSAGVVDRRQLKSNNVWLPSRALDCNNRTRVWCLTVIVQHLLDNELKF